MNIFSKTEIAQDYDSYYETEPGKKIDMIEKQAIQNLLTPIFPGTLLEIGCGTGHWTSFFSQMGFQITATDVSDAMLEQAKTKSIPATKLLKADVHELPFPDDYFDQAAVITAFEFCGDIPQAIKEIKRVLKPGGWLIAGCLNADSVIGQTKEHDPVFKHGYFMTEAELEAQLSIVGKPKIDICVHLSSDFKLLDHTPDQKLVEGVFMAATVQKIN